MDAGVASSLKTTVESASSHDNVSDQVFVHIVGSNSMARYVASLLYLHCHIIMIVNIRLT